MITIRLTAIDYYTDPVFHYSFRKPFEIYTVCHKLGHKKETLYTDKLIGWGFCCVFVVVVKPVLLHDFIIFTCYAYLYHVDLIHVEKTDKFGIHRSFVTVK